MSKRPTFITLATNEQASMTGVAASVREYSAFFSSRGWDTKQLKNVDALDQCTSGILLLSPLNYGHDRTLFEKIKMLKIPMALMVDDRENFSVLSEARPQLVVFNSYHLAELPLWQHAKAEPDTRCPYPSMVCHPPVDPSFWRTLPLRITKESGATAITSVNLNPRKGGSIFWELARRFPKTPFIGVKGWGRQQKGSLPNVSIVEFMEPIEFRNTVLSRTKIFLAPGDESFGRAGLEAAASAIPVIGHSNCLGLVESLGDALVDAGPRGATNSHELWEDQTARLLNDPKYYHTCAHKSLMQSQSSKFNVQLKEFEHRLRKTI